jgi:hypothetical protein
MSVDTWIDTMCGIWEIDDGKGGTVKSYRVYDKNEFPETIKHFPSAITYTTGANMEINSAGGISLWTGVTEFHLVENVDKSNIPYCMLFFARIRTAMASNFALGGLVSHLMFSESQIPNIQGPVELTYGAESPHLGIIVHWEVKERETDTPSA